MKFEDVTVTAVRSTTAIIAIFAQTTQFDRA